MFVNIYLFFKHCLAVEKLKVGRRRRRTRNGEGDVSCEKWDARCHQTSYFPSGPASSLIVMAILFVIIIFVRYSITKVEREIFNPCNSSKGNMVFWTCFVLFYVALKILTNNHSYIRNIYYTSFPSQRFLIRWFKNLDHIWCCLH